MSQQSFFDALANKSAAPRADQPLADCDEDEELIQNCIEVIRSQGNASVCLLQRRLRLGYARAERIMAELELRKVVGPLENGRGGAVERAILIECRSLCRKCGTQSETVNGFCKPCSAVNE